MPSLTIATKNTMLGSFTVAFLSLHTAYDPNGGNEVIGGSPAYARLPVTFGAPSAGQQVMTGAPYTFDVPTGTIAWIGMWNAGGGFLGMTPNAGSLIKPMVVSDPVSNTINCANHGLVVSASVVVWAGSGGALPFGLGEGTIYYLVTATSDTMQLSLTPGGFPATLSTTGGGYIQAITAVTNASQATFPVNALALDATVAA